MYILITILAIIGTIIVLILVVALFTKKDYSIQRDIVINRSTPEVFNYIKHLKNQDYYNKWVMKDPNMKKEFRGTDGTVGSVYAWDGNKQAGAGEQEIKSIVDNERIDIEIRFVRPFAAVSSGPFVTQALSADQTKLTWGLSSTMKYPMNAMLLFMNMDQLLGKDLETSLINLKNILENK